MPIACHARPPPRPAMPYYADVWQASHWLTPNPNPIRDPNYMQMLGGMPIGPSGVKASLHPEPNPVPNPDPKPNRRNKRRTFLSFAPDRMLGLTPTPTLTLTD